MTGLRGAATVRWVDGLAELEVAVVVAQWRLLIAETERVGERLWADAVVGYHVGD